ncbi:hypothetical protein BD410DRAFT_897332 [Rickenella mellea]|uniref:Programmed cell death protein 2 C-terminal domain-containing protein n=1 Tax=Rickenella mellea TaxID=50990 RepID=A0A4Y7Q7T0_9AGAM|nr:hypothetical protein BD410DRAFT_897332 [Rickenella mellea]
MPPNVEEDWSDSDSEDLSDVETSVLLGVPDGPITATADISDAAVSRLGGHPVRYLRLYAFLTSDPPFTSSQCKICSFPMELLVQLWCPFENNAYDRTLYVWGCSRNGCQKKNGSVRAWRGLRYNDKYAVKLEQRLARQKEKEEMRAVEEAKRVAEKAKPKVNPFSMNAPIAAGEGLFGAGLGTQLFGTAEPSPTVNESSEDATKSMENDDIDAHGSDEEDDGDDGEDDASSSSSSSEIVTALACASLSDSPWLAAPAYLPPLYLSTSGEYLPPAPKTKVQEPEWDGDDAEGKGKKGKKDEGGDASWALEGYENSMDMDHVFERFVKRVGYEGTQCIRYELNGKPLPYSSDAVFSSLFPVPTPATSLPTTRQHMKVLPAPQKRTYAPSASGVITPCPACGAERVFECQLMPNLINVLGRSSSSAVDAQGSEKAEKDAKDDQSKVEGEVGGENGPQPKTGKEESRGMEWGTCFVYSCERNCCLPEQGAKTVGKEEWAKSGWSEELVLVQWED